jgi:hypothetical protein
MGRTAEMQRGYLCGGNQVLREVVAEEPELDLLLAGHRKVAQTDCCCKIGTSSESSLSSSHQVL